jgi:hypothetical protein
VLELIVNTFRKCRKQPVAHNCYEDKLSWVQLTLYFFSLRFLCRVALYMEIFFTLIYVHSISILALMWHSRINLQSCVSYLGWLLVVQEMPSKLSWSYHHRSPPLVTVLSRLNQFHILTRYVPNIHLISPTETLSVRFFSQNVFVSLSLRVSPPPPLISCYVTLDNPNSSIPRPSLHQSACIRATQTRDFDHNKND